MKNITRHHFPRIRFDSDSGRRLLYNPANKKKYLPRPEERIRLEVMEFLYWDCGLPYNRISTELPVRPEPGKQLRADLLTYTKDMQPDILVECKAPEVKLSQLTAEQAARYNQKIGAGKIMLANGIQTLLYQIGKDGIHQIDFDAILHPREENAQNAEYWKGRGFLGMNAPDALVECIRIFYDTPGVYYLPVQPQGHDLPDLNHYYRVFQSSAGVDWAISFLGDERGATFLTGLKQQNGRADAIIMIPLDDVNPGIKLIMRNKSRNAGLAKLEPGDFLPLKPVDTPKIPEHLDKLIAGVQKQD